MAGTSMVTVTGLEKVISNMNKEVIKMRGKTFAGLIDAAIIVKRDVDKGNPKTPVKDRNLQHSLFITTATMTDKGGRGFSGDDSGKLTTEHSQTTEEAKTFVQQQRQPTLIMGYTAFYAVAVHEMGYGPKTAGKTIKWSRPGSGAKWFEMSLNRNRGAILATIAKHSKV